MAAITLEMVAAWLQQQNREGPAGTVGEEGEANIGSMDLRAENSSSEVPPTLQQDQPYDSEAGHVSHAPWMSHSYTSSNLFDSTVGMGDMAFNSIDLFDSSEDEDTYGSEDLYDEESSDYSVYTPTSVLSPALSSILGTTDDESDNDDDVSDGGSSASVPYSNVVVGCCICHVFFMVPKQTNVCPQCGTGNLVRFDGNAII
ncbi:uncharacterized protein LOC102720323 [Oryza brachyantha]|uniref:Uncharacterized protein n=1 Tax=Oryza brachyantha TaxID=4533 RepID=J3LXC7_ORYBR|nr:uncharacterized protein LOC102720323 [Oryza brachyantha]